MSTSTNDVHQAAWEAASRSATSAVVHAAVVTSPSICTEPPTFTSLAAPSTPSAEPTTPEVAVSSTTAPKNFLLSGKIANLFGVIGSKLEADFYSYHGELPAGLSLPSGVTTPIYQLATLKDDLKLSTILPKLVGTAFDHMPLKNVVFTYQNCEMDPSKSPGFYINADLIFDESFGSVHTALSTVLGIPNPTLHIQGSLGSSQSFNDPLQISGFSLSGTFADVVLKPCSELTLSAIGVELLGYKGVRSDNNGVPFGGMCYGFSVFGSMNVGLDQTLDLMFKLTDIGGQFSFKATQPDEWQGAFGVKGLNLKGLSFYTTLSPNAPLKDFSLSVSATLALDNMTASFDGSYNSDKTFSVSATMVDFGTAGLSAFYSQLHGSALTLPKVSISIGNATLKIASAGVFSLVLQDVSVEHYTGVDATVDFSSAGVEIKSNLMGTGSGEQTLTFGEIEIEKAYIQLSLAAGSSGQSSAIIGGELHWETFTFDAGVHIYRAPAAQNPDAVAQESQADTLQWTVFADFVTDANASQGLALAAIVPELKGSFLGDITLEDAAFIVASQDDPDFGSFNTTNFPAKQGIQVCAKLGMIKALSDLMRVTDPPQLILSAGWSKADGFELDVLLPAPMTIHLGRGIVTDPFTLQIRTVSPTTTIIPPTLLLNAGVKIPTSGNPEPLHFTLALAFNAVEGSATGQLEGYWTNPFGLSEHVRIGPEVALTIGIVLETLTISPFGFVGGLQVGNVNIQVAFEVSEIPSQELLYAEVQNFDITDVVLLARDFGIPIPVNAVPDFMVYRDIKFYMCPAGTTIGGSVYPRGTAFSADMLIFGQDAQVNVQIDQSNVNASASLDNLALGPLHVTGIDGPKATGQVQLGPQTQAGSFQGRLTLFELEVDIDLQFEFKPDPMFHFHFMLQFTPHRSDLTFTVDANQIGPMANIHDMSHLDFTLVAEMRQDILGYVAQAVNSQFAQAIKAEQADIGAQQAKVDAAKKVVDDAVKAKQAVVDAAYKQWKDKSDAMNARFKATTDAYDAHVQQLQDQVDAVTAKYKKDLADAQQKLTNANASRASQMKAAQEKLDKAKKDCTDGIAEAKKKLDDATRDMNSRFGDAEKKIDDAQQKVKGIQKQIDDIDGKIDHLNHLTGIHKIEKAGLPALYIAKGTLVASMKVSQGILDAAKAVLQSQNYLAAKGVMAAAQDALEVAQKAGQAGIDAAQGIVTATDKATQDVVTAAGASLAQVGKLGPVAIKVASDSLDAFKKVSVATLNAAKASVDAVAKGSEWVAYQSALTGLNAAKLSTHDLDLANGALELVKKGGADILKASDYVASHALTLVDIHYMRFDGEFGKAAAGAEFNVTMQGSVAGKPFSLNLTFDPRKTVAFITNTFHKLVDEVSRKL
ncbi:FAD-binding PCMH-type domain-containing protein [Mycena chlorophos]|uniref:FAD-binding PCMH-type domain-containing protein n=1 Tax=Mycena chlorophos TaxID=658473 RepID=A0A8H6SN32_MYCCL|nr:FAD-binding PCMH-type domain-containing protein [Mycena chlorophos]